MEAFVKKYFVVIIIFIIIGWVIYENKKRTEQKRKGADKDRRNADQVKKAVKELRSRKNDYVRDTNEDENPLRRGEFTSDTPSDEVGEMYEQAIEQYMKKNNYTGEDLKGRLQAINDGHEHEDVMGDDAGEFLEKQEFDDPHFAGDLN